MKKIGIFAGTFDPIHNGHLAFAEEALQHGLEKVMFLPEPRPRRKQGVRALEHRLAMVQLAVAHDPRFGTIILEQARFTPHETLPLLQARFPGHKLMLLFGGDVISHMAHWPHVEALTNNVELLIAGRREEEDFLKATIKTLQQTRGLKFTYHILHPAQEQVASSALRLRLKRGQAVPDVPEPVKRYIYENGLYTSGAGSS